MTFVTPEQFSFRYQSTQAQNARLGILQTPHGGIETPAFIFCATRAAMKSLTIAQLREAHTQIILSNTYHLMLQPGPAVVAAMGGLPKFTGWHGPMLTDSGGFQIFSLGHGNVSDEIKGRRYATHQKSLLSITEEGATFKSYINGATYHLSPEKSIEIQQQLGADLIVVLDECTPFHVDYQYTAASMQRSHRWAQRCLRYHTSHASPQQRLYGIVQGGVYPELRHNSCQFLNDHAFFGHAIGGSLGAKKSQMYDIVALSAAALDKARPIHLLGIGGLQDILHGVLQGIDTFDCVHPTRIARHGGALAPPEWRTTHKREHLNLKNAGYIRDERPLVPGCGCYTCQQHSRGYIHHLLKAEPALAFSLLSIHNVYFMNQFMQAIRHALASHTMPQLLSTWQYCTETEPKPF